MVWPHPCLRGLRPGQLFGVTPRVWGRHQATSEVASIKVGYGVATPCPAGPHKGQPGHPWRLADSIAHSIEPVMNLGRLPISRVYSDRLKTRKNRVMAVAD